jgi:DNA-binding LacI/PurR family transcriptional regulator
MEARPKRPRPAGGELDESANKRRAALGSLDGSETAKARPAVMADVARLAGVSHQTVSRVLNESDGVRRETRERVVAAMRMLNYRPNLGARALATGRSKTLGVITFDTALYGPASALFAIERAAHVAGFFVSIASMYELDAPSLRSAANSLLSQNVEGILVIAPVHEVALAAMQLPNDVPVVAVEAGPREGMLVASVDQHAGAAQATRHLLDLGHATVWHIAGPQDWLEAVERVSGWRETLLVAGARVPEPLVGDWSAASGYELGARLVDDPDVTAVFVANDAMALGLLRRLHEAGREVPGSISVVGFDDVPEAAFYTPPLTTVRQDFMELGRSSFELVLAAIESGGPAATRVTIGPRLVVRASTAQRRA